MKQHSIIRMGAALLIVAFAVSAMAQAPLIVNHQGRLLDGNNQPVNGTVNMIFTIWDDSVRGLSHWTETQDVLVRNGIFNVRLGQFNPFDPAIFNLSAVQLWLETQVGGETLVPRTLLNSVPFSFDTRSIRGDVQTGPGSIQIGDPGLSPSSVLIEARDNSSSIVMLGPPDPVSPVLSLTNDATGASLVMSQPGPPDIPLMTLRGTSTGSSLVMQQPGPPDSPSLHISVSADGGVISFTGSSGATMMNLNSGGGGYFMGNLGFGTSDATNILTVVQRSATQPIADSWTTYSSRRWKKNIRTLDGALNKVMRLRGVSYDWKADDKHDIGLIAEEVGEVIPEVVTYETNGVDAKSVDYARLTALLIEAVKQQQKAIDELKSEVSELRAQTPRQASIGAEK